MSKQNKNRRGCIDTFHAFLVQNATYDSELEIPCIKPTADLPNRLIPFSKAVSSTDNYDAWVHFYEDDIKFERLWNQPNRYLPILMRYAGVITPDYSLYRDMPLVMQYWNIYRSHAIGHWLQENGQSVITNVRFGDSRTLSPSCAGTPTRSSIAIGTHGCMRPPVSLAGAPLYHRETAPPGPSLSMALRQMLSLINTVRLAFRSYSSIATTQLLTERR